MSDQKFTVLLTKKAGKFGQEFDVISPLDVSLDTTIGELLEIWRSDVEDCWIPGADPTRTPLRDSHLSIHARKASAR